MKNEYNTKLDKNIESFIQMRIEGKSFDDIAAELKVSKQSLIEWNKKEIAREAIKEGTAFRINSLVKTYKFDLSNRLDTYLKISQKINKELLERDFSKITSTSALLNMSLVNDNRIKELIGNKTFEIGKNPSIFYIGDNEDGFFNISLDE